MLEVLIGIISGVISGTGMGGGTILILILSVFMGIEQHVAQATNIVFFIPTSIVAIIVSFKQKLIDVKTGIVVIIFGIIGAGIGAKLAGSIKSEDLKRYFGIFLGLIACYQIYEIVRQYILKLKSHNKIKGGN